MINDIDDPLSDIDTTWKKWFAWYPVTTVSGQRIWLSWCYRREYDYLVDLNSLIGETVFQYGTIFDVISQPDV